MIPYGHQEITQSDVDAVVAVLSSDCLTQGPAVPAFEQAVSARVGARHAVAVNSATSALHIACMALGLVPGDRLWTVPNTFVASANCGRYCGAEVDFVDIDPSPEPQRSEAGREACSSPEIQSVAHDCGACSFCRPADRPGGDLGIGTGIWFQGAEDASHAIGASRHREPVGSCRWSDITVFSFHPVKIITTGEGGMALTNDGRLAERMMMLRNHGVTRDPVRFQSPGCRPDEGAPPAWYYEQQMLGFNYRMTDIHAALGASQLERLDGYIARRNVLAQRYNKALAQLSLQVPTVQPGNQSAFHLYVVRLEGRAMPRTQRQVLEELRRQGIGVNLHYRPVHLQPYYRELGFAPGQYPEAEAHGESAVTLPLYAALSDQEQDRVVGALTGVFSHS